MHGYDTWMVTESKVPTYDPMYKPLAFDSTAGESLRYGWRALETKEYEDYGTKYWTGAEIFETNLEGDDARVIMDRVIPFIEDASVRKMPFFATIWIHTPHLPVVSDLRHRMMYADRSAEDQLYFGTISAMDEQIGRLTDKLVELGIQNNTLIWFCSDNGPERGTPGSSGGFRERKRSLYEGGVRVPAFIYWPDQVEPGQQTNFPMFTSDFLPTLVDLLAIDFHPPVVLDGISVKEALLNGQEVRDKAMGFLFPQKVSWVTQHYKLISTDDGATFELYDLLHDPQETTNLFESHPEVVKKLKAELETWHSSVMQEYSRVVENQ